MVAGVDAPSSVHETSRDPPGDARIFGRNLGAAALAQLITQVLTLVASIVLARELSVAAYGLFVFGFAFPSWFLLLVSLGLDEVIAMDVAADRSRAGRYLTLVVMLRAALSAVALVGLWLATHAVLADPQSRTVTLVLGAASVVTTNANTFTAVFRAFEKLEYGALVTIVERSATVTFVVLLVLLGYGLLEVSLAFLGGSLLLLAMAAAISKRRFAWVTRKAEVGGLIHILRLGLPFGLFNVVGTLTHSIGLVLLALLRGPEAAGLFNAAFTLLFALFSFLSIVSLTSLPMMSRINRQSRERLASVVRQIQRLSLIGGVPLAFGGWLYAESIIVTFYGDAFRESADTFRILLVSFAVETAVMGIGPALAATGHAREKLFIATAGAAVTVSLSILLIPSQGLLGAAYAFLASRLVIASLGALAVRRYVAPIRALDTMAKAVVAGALMFLVLTALPGTNLWMGIAVGGAVYLGALVAMQGMSREDGVVVWRAVRGALLR